MMYRTEGVVARPSVNEIGPENYVSSRRIDVGMRVVASL